MKSRPIAFMRQIARGIPSNQSLYVYNQRARPANERVKYARRFDGPCVVLVCDIRDVCLIGDFHLILVEKSGRTKNREIARASLHRDMRTKRGGGAAA